MEEGLVVELEVFAPAEGLVDGVTFQHEGEFGGEIEGY